MTDTKVANLIIVDDSDFSRKQVSEILEKNKIKVGCSLTNAADAITFAQKNTVDIAIIDVVMPEMSGMELARKLIELNSKVLLIMISSLTQERIVLESIDLGAHDFIRKPINEPYLIDSVKKAVTTFEEA